MLSQVAIPTGRLGHARSLRRWAGRGLPLFALLLVAGCGGGESTKDNSKAAPPYAGLELKVVVVGDDALATAVSNLAGEWKAQTGSSLSISTISDAEFLDAGALNADVAFVPSYLAGIAKQRDWIQAPSPSVEDNPQLKWRDILVGLRHHEATWNQNTIGIPLGAPRLLLAYRADLLRTLGQGPPRTWPEYYALAQALQDNAEEGSPAWGSAEPSSDSWLALTFLAKAAPLAKHENHFSAAFDMETMEPLIAGSAFVETLQDWVASRAALPPADQQISPADAYGLLRSGKAGMAITWSAATWNQAQKVAGCEIAFVTLPGSSQVYVPGSDEITSTEFQRVSLTHIAGSVGVVSANTEGKTRDAAWQLIIQLVGDSWGTQVNSSSPFLMMNRTDQVSDATRWLPPDDSAAAGSLATAIEAAINADDALTALPIPGRDRYLQSLAAGIRRALAEEQTAQDALQQVATEWSQINEDLGTSQQRIYYRASVTDRY